MSLVKVFNRHLFKHLFFALICFVPFGCAKYPKDLVNTVGARLIFAFTVNNRINPNYIYVVALRTSTDLNPTDGLGPLPLTQPPWGGGDGIVSGACTHYIKYDARYTAPFRIYKFLDNLLNNSREIDFATRFDTVDNSSRTLRFELDLTQLTDGNAAQAAALQSVQVNFLTMDKIPVVHTDRKIWDALGNSQDPSDNRFISVPLDVSGFYDNDYYGRIEPIGDVADADLDIVNFSVEVIKV